MNEIECRYFWEELSKLHEYVISLKKINSGFETVVSEDGETFSFIAMPEGLFGTK